MILCTQLAFNKFLGIYSKGLSKLADGRRTRLRLISLDSYDGVYADVGFLSQLSLGHGATQTSYFDLFSYQDLALYSLCHNDFLRSFSSSAVSLPTSLCSSSACWRC
jgi:hypothetical protein